MAGLGLMSFCVFCSSVGPCKNITGDEVSLAPEVEFVKVRCMPKGKKRSEVYTNMHAVPAPKKDVMAKLEKQERWEQLRL